MPKANKNKPKPKAKLYFGNADELAKTNNYVTPEYLQEVDKRRKDWNEFIGFLKKENVAGSENLDKGGAGLGYLKKWNKANPDKAFTQEDIKDVQYYSRNTKKETGERVNDGILGKVTSTFSFPDSRVNTYEMKNGQKVLVKSEDPNIGNYQYQADKINFGIAGKNKADVSKLPIYNKNSATTDISWDKNDPTANNLLKEQAKKRSLSGQSLSKPEQFVKPLTATEYHPAVQEQLEGSYFDNNQKVVDYNQNLQQQKQAEVQQQADTRTALQKKLATSKSKDFTKEEALDYFNETGKVLPQNKVQGKYNKNKQNQIIGINDKPLYETESYRTLKDLGYNIKEGIKSSYRNAEWDMGSRAVASGIFGAMPAMIAPIPTLAAVGAWMAQPAVTGLGDGIAKTLKKKTKRIKNEEFGMPTFQDDNSDLTQKREGGVIKDNRGQWAHPGEITEIGSNNITMQGVNYPVLGVSDQGDTQMMYPEQDYQFRGNKVTEYPMMQNESTLQKNTNMEYGKGGYTVKRSSDRKGKTHVVIGPDGTKKYFGDPNLGEKGKSKYGKEAFYARHKKNLDANPYFRAYARATWEEGGTTPKFNYNNSEINQVTGIPTGKGGLEDASSDVLQAITAPLALANLYKAGKISYDAYQLAKPGVINLSKTYAPTYRKALLQAGKALSPFEYGGMIPEQGHISMNKRSLFKYGGLTVTDLNKYQDGGSKGAAGSATKTATLSGSGSPTPSPTGATVSGSAIGAGIGFGAEMVGALIPEKQYTDDEGTDLGSVKSVGESTLEYGAKGAAVTAMLGGADFGIATALGAGYGAYKGWADKEEMQEKQKEANFKNNQRKLSSRMNNSVNFGNADINTSNNMMFAVGGMVLDYDDPNANAELELQETFQMPNGQVGNVDGPSHENGGIAVDLPEGTRIWSDKLKYGGKTFAKHTKPITSKIARLEKEIEEDPTKSKAKQNSVMLLNQQLDHYFDVQETNKEANEMKRTFKNGGMIKRADGSYSKRGLWDNIRANKGSGKKPTPEMLEQERKIKAKMEMGGEMYGMGGSLNMYQRGGRRLNLETPTNNMEQRWIKPEDNTPQSVNSFEYPVEPDFDMNNISEELYGNYGQTLPRSLMATTRSMNQPMGTPPIMPPIERATGRYGEFVTPQVSNPNANIPFDQLPIGVTKPNTNLNLGQFGANASKYIAPENLTMGNVGKPVTDYRSMYENDPNIPKGQLLGSTAGAGMDNLGFMAEPQGFFNKAGQFIQNNPGLIGQLGTAALTAGTQMNRVNNLARPRTLADVRLRDNVANPNLVDYSAERNAIDRAALTGMAEAQKGFGSSAAAQAFKNKARLNQLEGTGRSFQGQENANAQIKNQFLAAKQEAAMKEAMMNNDISKYNLENVYGYDTMTTAQKNAITAMLGNTAGQTFGKQTDYANQMQQAKVLANSRDNTVNYDSIAGTDQDTREYYMSLPEQQRIQYNAARTRRNLTPYSYGGMMKRSFRTGGTNNPGFNALPESVQENIVNNMGMGGYMYSLGGRLMDDHMYAEGGKLPKNVLQSRLEAHMSPEEIDSYLNAYADGGIHIKPSKVGSLRKHLGTPEGKKIPMSKLADKPGDSPAIKKKKVFARNARKWNS